MIPQKTSGVLRLRVPGLVFLAALLAVALFLFFGGLGLYRSTALEKELAEFHSLRNQYLRQQVEIKKVSNALDGFRTEITKLRELDYKLRLITDLEVERPSPSLYGIGGSIDLRKDGLAGQAELAGMDLIALLDKDLARLKEMANYQEESFNNLKAFLVDQKDRLERSPYRWPVRGFVSSNFGPRGDPFTGLQRHHDGTDIVAPAGTVVRAPADGIVTYTSVDPSLGHMMVIDHGYGVITRYGHNEVILVREGQRVKRGDPVAQVGSSGKSTGPHLHYEIRINDVAVNPLNYILE
ncbi:MAG: M23 family metallopeptidase, partial [bacterium]